MGIRKMKWFQRETKLLRFEGFKKTTLKLKECLQECGLKDETMKENDINIIEIIKSTGEILKLLLTKNS